MSNVCNFTPTNIFTSANFDVLNIDGVEDPLIDVNTLATLDFEESYFYSAIKFVNECDNELTSHKLKLYDAIMESNSTVYVLESFSDFFTKVKDIIDKFLKFIKSLFKRFTTAIFKFINSDKYLAKYKTDLDDFKTSDEFKFNGYKYTFRDDIPTTTRELNWDVELFNDIDSVNVSITNSYDRIKNAIDFFNLEEKCDAFRSNILNQGRPITVSNFEKELHKVFRDGKSDTSQIIADKAYINEVKNRFFNYKSMISNLNKANDEIKRSYEDLSKKVQNIMKREGGLNKGAFEKRLPDGLSNYIVGTDGVEEKDGKEYLKGDLALKLDTYMELKCTQIIKYSEIHALAFSKKLDAINECVKQDRNTLYTALNRVQRTDNRRKEG